MKNMKLPKSVKFVVGIDEVGRGPLAGPVAIGVFKMPIDFNAKKFGKTKDSKKLKSKQREEIAANGFDLAHKSLTFDKMAENICELYKKHK